MQWWAWVAIWAGLVLGLVAMLVLLAIRLFRKAMRVLEALGDLGENVARLQDQVEVLQERDRPLAILEGYARVSRRHDRLRDERLAKRDERRQAAVQRGKLLIHSVPTRRT